MEQSGLVDLSRLVVRPIAGSERDLWDHRDTLKHLSAPFPTPFMLTGAVPPPPLDLNRLDLSRLVAHMETVKDPRKRSGVRYRFSTPLSILVLAALLGVESLRQISPIVDPLPQKTLKELGCMQRRIYLPPEESIFRRCLKAVDMPSFLQATARWLENERRHRIIPEALLRLEALRQRQKAGEAR